MLLSFGGKTSTSRNRYLTTTGRKKILIYYKIWKKLRKENIF